MPDGAKPDGEKGGREDEGMVVAVLNKGQRKAHAEIISLWGLAVSPRS